MNALPRQRREVLNVGRWWCWCCLASVHFLFAFWKCFRWHQKWQINILTERYYKRSCTSPHLIMRPVLHDGVYVRWRCSPSLHRSRAWWSLGSVQRCDQPTPTPPQTRDPSSGERDSMWNGAFRWSPGTRVLRHNYQLFIWMVRAWLSITALYLCVTTRDLTGFCNKMGLFWDLVLFQISHPSTVAHATRTLDPLVLKCHEMSGLLKRAFVGYERWSHWKFTHLMGRLVTIRLIHYKNDFLI